MTSPDEAFNTAPPPRGRLAAQSMRAVWLRRYGGPDVLEIIRQPVPRPASRDVLVRVHASSLNPRDTLIRAGRYPFQPLIRLPCIPGSDVAGTVVERGRRVTSLALGQPVYGMQPSRRGLGAHAEYVVVPASALAPKPDSISFHEAAGIPLAGLTAYQALTQCLAVQPGRRLLIVGASGGVGTYAVQMAHALGAHVTAVTSGRNVDWVADLGADRVLDYQTVSFLEPETLPDGEPYDGIFDVVGRHDVSACRRVLASLGVYVTTIPRRRQLVAWAASSLGRYVGRHRPRTSVVLVRSDGRHLRRFKRWIDDGKLRTVIEGVLPMDAVAQAHRQIQTARTRGKLILDMEASATGAEPAA